MSDIQYTPISEYEKANFSAETKKGKTITHDVYSIGEGAPIVLIQELPGIGKETLRLADRFVAKGFKVILPHLFGPLEKISTGTNMVRVFCMQKEFTLFAKNKTSPIVDWLKALCQEVRTSHQVKGVGVIGMCLTGNFAISLMADENVLAAVASQPAMPFLGQKSLHMSAEDIQQIKNNIDKTAPMMAYRFEGDWMCTGDKFHCIQQTFNEEGKERVLLKTIPGKYHAVLTIDFVDEAGHPTYEALQEVLQYFSKQLQ